MHGGATLHVVRGPLVRTQDVALRFRPLGLCSCSVGSVRCRQRCVTRLVGNFACVCVCSCVGAHYPRIALWAVFRTIGLCADVWALRFLRSPPISLFASSGHLPRAQQHHRSTIIRGLCRRCKHSAHTGRNVWHLLAPGMSHCVAARLCSVGVESLPDGCRYLLDLPHTRHGTFVFGHALQKRALW